MMEHKSMWIRRTSNSVIWNNDYISLPNVLCKAIILEWVVLIAL